MSKAAVLTIKLHVVQLEIVLSRIYQVCYMTSCGNVRSFSQLLCFGVMLQALLHRVAF